MSNKTGRLSKHRCEFGCRCEKTVPSFKHWKPVLKRIERAYDVCQKRSSDTVVPYLLLRAACSVCGTTLGRVEEDEAVGVREHAQQNRQIG